LGFLVVTTYDIYQNSSHTPAAQFVTPRKRGSSATALDARFPRFHGDDSGHDGVQKGSRHIPSVSMKLLKSLSRFYPPPFARPGQARASGRSSPFWRRVLFIVWLLAAAACAPAATLVVAPAATLVVAPATLTAATPTEMPALASAAIPSATPEPVRATLVVAPTNAFTPSLTPSLPPQTAAPIQIVVLADNLPGPDDLAWGPDGSIFMSDVTDGTVKRLTPEGNWQTLVSGLNEPEGLVALPDGSLLIAEQGKNRLVRYTPSDQSLKPFLSLKNNTQQPGVDGIALDAVFSGAPSLIVPDSPNGALLRVSLDGQTVSTIARGLVRPTSVWVEADGSLLVTDEYGGALNRVRPDGAVELLARLSLPDDVAEDSLGNIFVTTLGDGAVHWLKAHNRQESVLLKGLSSPQGLLVDAEGNLIVTDPGHHRLIRITLH
jgi:sugar lactone lactonase YvrE